LSVNSIDIRSFNQALPPAAGSQSDRGYLHCSYANVGSATVRPILAGTVARPTSFDFEYEHEDEDEHETSDELE